MKRKTQKVSFEEISKEKLRKQLIEDIESIDVEVLINSEPGLFVKISKKTTEVKLIISTSTKKIAAWFGSTILVLSAVVKIASWLLPILVGHFSKPPP